MDDPDLYIDDITTDTSESDSSLEPSSTSEEGQGLFKGNTPFVLELHDIRKDDLAMPPAPPTTDGGAGIIDPLVKPTVAKLKKHRKKKKASDPGAKERRASFSTDSMSDDASSMAPSATNAKEEFYDARESYHAIPENEVPTVAQLAVQPEAVQNLKAQDLDKKSQIIKPTSPP